MIRRGYHIDDFTSEFTIQHRLALFLDAYLSKKYECELEVSVEKFGWKNLTKKEIDIVVSSTEERHAIELKFIRDQGSFNIGIYGVCEDVRFLEELKDGGFESVCSYVFTTLPDVFTPTNGAPNPKNPQNMSLYVQFRNAKNLQRKIAIKTGALNKEVNFERSHPFSWMDFVDGVKGTSIAE